MASKSRHHPYRYESSDDEITQDSKPIKSPKVSFKEESGKEVKHVEEVEKNEKKAHKVKTHILSDVQHNGEETDGALTDGKDNACIEMSSYFVNVLKNTIQKEDSEALRETLHKTPLPVVLHYAHYLFFTVRDNQEFTDIMLEYNKKYNIVSKYFLKSLRDEERATKSMEMLIAVTSEMMEGKRDEDIKHMGHFTPEFRIMIAIQYGEIEKAFKIKSEWEITSRFSNTMDLIAAYFGIKRYFSKSENYTERRELIIAAICGGSPKTLSRILRKTSNQYMTDYTLRKTRGICIPNSSMVKYLRQKHGLEFS